MRQLATLFKKEILELTRSRKMTILACVFIIFSVLSVVTAKLTPLLLKNFSVPGMVINLPEPTYMDSIDQFVKNTSQLISFILIFIVSGAIADEKFKRTLEIVLAKPVSKAKFVISKFAAIFTALLATYTVSSLIFYFYTVSVFGSFSFGRFAVMSALSVLFLLVITALTLLGSAWTRSSIKAAGFSFLVFVIISITAALLPKYGKFYPSYIYSNYRDLMLHGWKGEYIYQVWSSLAIIAISVILAIWLFSRQEVER